MGALNAAANPAAAPDAISSRRSVPDNLNPEAKP
ncbi:hypothetical protein IMAU10378_03023 [Lactiplantibacillus plantarum]|nr:hypothetical protein [Lactiplantibacillus plantarum]QHM35682.1 hypothetical protein C7M35_03103 [Lactiplantibacillus plantarum]